ncbi:MAG TPA: DUF502 domain-containing protein [Stellaceae bacterium]|nr:DUF502 domain-containing protein [Stellaceae bacterium]
MPADTEPASLPPRRRRQRVIERLRAYFITGVLVTGPITFTVYLTWIFVHFIDASVGELLPREYNPATYFPLPGLGLVIGIVGLILVGALAAGYFGRLLLRISERIVQRMPVVRSVYSAAKQIFETVLASQSNTFREVVLTQWPRPGMWTVAFVTTQPQGEIAEHVGADSVAIYVPTTPNPTSGYLMFVPRRELITLTISVDEAIKLILSGGIIVPPDRRPVAAAKPAAIAAPQR